jgi:hypothetical protein
MNHGSNASSHALFDVRPVINQGPDTTNLPAATWWEVEYTKDLDHLGIMQIGCARMRLQFQFQALRWWQRLCRGMTYQWRLECLYHLRHAYHWMEETHGQDWQKVSPYTWTGFLDGCAGMVVDAWSAMPWRERWLYAVKVLTWLVYLREIRPFDLAQVMGDNPAKTPDPSGGAPPDATHP